MTSDTSAETPHFASARRFGLYTEIFCDRAALSVVKEPLDVIAMLVKVHTGLDDVDAESYLRQAGEILGQGPLQSEELSHPEAYIRAHAIRLWHEGRPAVDAEIAELIERPVALDELDFLGQQQIMRRT
ncbi:MAG: peptidase M48, partial [Planctomycetota bacterium]|nr:peptidase M48 [Planctomycetota bacterium]